MARSLGRKIWFNRHRRLGRDLPALHLSNYKLNSIIKKKKSYFGVLYLQEYPCLIKSYQQTFTFGSQDSQRNRPRLVFMLQHPDPNSSSREHKYPFYDENRKTEFVKIYLFVLQKNLLRIA